jgi:hypothetical protein
MGCTLAPAMMPRIAWIGHQHAITGVDQHLGEVEQPFLGTDQCDGLFIRVDLHAEAPAVILGRGTFEGRRPTIGGVSVHIRAAGRLLQTLDDEIGRRQVRGTHVDADDIHAFGFQFNQALAQRGKEIGFESSNTLGRFVNHVCISLVI